MQNLQDKKEEIEEHMDITLRLTLANKPENLQSYLELENEAIVKVQEERRELKERQKLERKKAQAEVDKMIREEDESRKMREEAERTEENDRKRKLRDERMTDAQSSGLL